MKSTNPRYANLKAKDDLSFIPPMAQHVRYIELARRFLGEDLETSQLVPSGQDKVLGGRFRKKTRPHKAA